MARPINSKVNLKDGYYIEVCNIGANSGIKIRRETYEGIQIALKKYKKFYDVNYMGKIENGKRISDKK